VSGGRLLAARQWAGGPWCWRPGSGSPTHAPGPRLAPRQPVPRSFPRHFRHSSDMAPNPYI